MPRSDIAHYDGLTYWGPLSIDRMEQIQSLLTLPEGAPVLDVGCGRGELLARLTERFGVHATAVDRSAAALGMVRAAFEARCPEHTPTLVEEEAAALTFDDGAFDLVIWLGGPYLGEHFNDTIDRLKRWTRPGGQLLLGHGFWAAPPPEGYLSATGIDPDELGAHWENIEAGKDADLTLLYTCVSSRDEWDGFEGRILFNHERYAASNPTEEGVVEMIERKREWNLAQQRWGRAAMGFGLYLFGRPDAAPAP